MNLASRAGLFLVAAGPAFAAPPPDPDPALREWFEGLRQPGNGTPCCSLADCRRVEARKGDAGWEVWIDGRFGVATPVWEKVPPSKVLKTTNPTGEAVACFAASVGIMCFVPPPEM